MAAYAAVADVQSRIPTQLCTLGPQSQPTKAQVEAWLEEQSRWIDAVLRWKYAVPVTAADDLTILKPICANLAAAMVWDVIAGHDPNYANQGVRLVRNAREALAYDPKCGQALLVLPSTTESDTGPAATGQPLGSFSDPEAAGSTGRFFSTGMDL